MVVHLKVFVYIITDRDTNAVSGHDIQFNITSRPTGSTGDALVNVSNTTNDSGKAIVQLLLGDKVGIDSVKAEDPSVLGSARFFTGIINHGKAMKMIQSSVSTLPDTIGTTFNNIGVTIADRGDNPVDSIIVHYNITSSAN